MYELSNDTLGHSSNIPCDMAMNRKYDDCIYSEFHARLLQFKTFVKEYKKII